MSDIQRSEPKLPPRFAWRILRLALALTVVYWMAQKGHYFMYQGF